MGYQWELEYPGLRLDGNQAAWNLKNIGDEVAPSGTEIGTATITSRPNPQSPSPVVTVTNPLSIDRDVESQTSHPMTYPLNWSGIEAGAYTFAVVFGDASAEMYYVVDHYGNCTHDI